MREEAVDPASESGDFVNWTTAYREGLAEGMVIDRNGYFALPPWLVRHLVAALAPLRDHGKALLVDLAERVEETDISHARKQDIEATVEKLGEAAHAQSDPAIADALTRIAGHVTPPG